VAGQGPSSSDFATTPIFRPAARRIHAATQATGLKRVLVYGMNYAPEVTGVGRYTAELAEHLAAIGADVTVITTPAHYPVWRVEKPFTNTRYAVEVRNNVRVVRCPLFLHKKMSGFWRLVAPLTFAATSTPAAILQTLHRRPDTIICVEPTLFVTPVALVLSKLFAARSVLYVQDLEVDAAFAVGHLRNRRWMKVIGSILERCTLPFFDRIVTISNSMAEKIRQKGVAPARIAMIRNWVDLDRFHPISGASSYRKSLNYDASDFVVLYSGSIGAKQELNVLLDAARLLASESKIKFVVAGEGPAKESLMRAYKDLTNVKFLPFQPDDSLNAFLSFPDIHALTQSHSANDLVLPSKLGGMLASGKRILVTANVGTELADFLGARAIVTPPGDPAELAAAILAARSETTDLFEQQRLALARTLSKEEGLRAFCAYIGVGNELTEETSGAGTSSALASTPEPRISNA